MTNEKFNIEDIVFPQYRRYKNNKSYFKILSMTSFEEKYFVGRKKLHRIFEVTQYPEMVLIRDLLFNYEGMAEKISSSEYDQV